MTVIEARKTSQNGERKQTRSRRTRQTVAKLYNEGLTVLEIAKRLGKTRAAIYFHLHKLNLQPKCIREMHKANPITKNGRRKCARCGKTKPLSEYRSRSHAFCARCCYRAESQSPKRTLNRIFHNRKNNAEKRRMEFRLTFPDILLMLAGQTTKRDVLCPYTGEKLEISMGRGRGYRPNGLSIDRIDSSRKVYDREGCVLCTRRANILKGELTLREFAKRHPEYAEHIRTFLRKRSL